MDASVVRRVLTGTGVNAYGQAVTVVVQLVGVPVLLHAWGARLYGEWLTLFAIPAFLSMTDLGFSHSAANDMTGRVSRGDRSGAISVFQSLTILICSLAALGLVASAILIWVLPIDRWLPFEAMDRDTIRCVLWLFAAQIFVSLLHSAIYAGLRAGGDYAMCIGLDSTVRLLQFVGVWVCALLGSGPVAAAASFFGVRAFAFPIVLLALRHRHPWLRLGFAEARANELRRLTKPALGNCALPLAHVLHIQGLVLAIGAVLGPVAVVVFSTLRTLTRMAFQVVAAVSHATEPELAAAYGAGSKDVMRRLFTYALRVSFWLALSTVIGLALLGDIIINVWTRGQVEMNWPLFAWLLGSAFASVLWYGALILLRAANRHFRFSVVYVLASVAAVMIAALVVASTRSAATAGIALLIMDLIMIATVTRGAAQLLEVPATKTLVQAANPFPLVVLVFAKGLGR